MFKIVHYGETNVGRERKNNEDALRVAVGAGAYLVCDGMGGHASGEIASQIAADAVVRFLAMDRFRPDFRWPPESSAQQSEEGRALDAAVRSANREVFLQAQANPLHKGMGTTIVGVYAGAQRLGLVHVGDSRIYRLRNGEFDQLTDDHSLLNYYMNTRPMSAQQIKSFAGKNVIVRAVGLRENVEPDVQITDYRHGDVYLLCSDGLNDMVEDEQLAAAMVGAKDNLAQVGSQLIQMALDAGGKDNVTVLLLQTVEVPDQAKTVPFFRRTLPMNALDALDTSPYALLEDLDHEEDVGTTADHETMPEVRVNVPAKLSATQPMRPMARDDLTPPAGIPVYSNAGRRPTSSQEPTEKIPLDVAAQVRAARQAQEVVDGAALGTSATLSRGSPSARDTLKLGDFSGDTDPHGIGQLVVVVRATVGADAAAPAASEPAESAALIGADTLDLPAMASSKPLPTVRALGGADARDIDGPTLPLPTVPRHRAQIPTPRDVHRTPSQSTPAVQITPDSQKTPSAETPGSKKDEKDGIDGPTQ
ncbi:MAG: serine/threonine-protein phosphatase [Myxococcales bacterium]|nr:serine/threonine-protein phosphatase [Myxococcales bacterium]